MSPGAASAATGVSSSQAIVRARRAVMAAPSTSFRPATPWHFICWHWRATRPRMSWRALRARTPKVLGTAAWVVCTAVFIVRFGPLMTGERQLVDERYLAAHAALGGRGHAAAEPPTPTD